MDMTVLQIGEHRESPVNVVIGPKVDIGVEFPAPVVIIFLQRINRTDIVAHPFHLPVMMPVEIRNGTSKRRIPSSSPEIHGGLPASETIHIVFQPDKIRLFYCRTVSAQERLEAIFNQSTVGLVLVIIPVILSVKQCRVDIEPLP